MIKQDTIYPGKTWLDTNGKPIQAHGGAIYYEDGTYYWYGENKENTDGVNPIWTYGIKVYSSKDLYNWDDRGFLIPPVLDDESSSLHPYKRLDRPHIIKCPTTGKYVCWIKLSGKEGCFTILQADNFLGPYELVYNEYQPDSKKIGDFDLVIEGDNAYLFTVVNHESVVTYLLQADFLSVKEKVAEQYKDLKAPFSREAPAVFEYNNVKYMLTSGMTGYVPNKSDMAISSSWDSEFQSVGNPCINDESQATFNSQISKVFKVPNKELYIILADRWVPECIIDAKKSDIITRGIASYYDPEKYKMTSEEQEIVSNLPLMGTANTSKSRYVWLPLTINDDGKPNIHWYDEWRIEDFD